MQLTLGQAAKQVGVSKPTLSKAISTGKLSATRREDGSWSIDPAELHRYVEANQHRFQPATGNPWRSETPESAPGNGGHPDIGALAEAHGRASLAEQEASQLRAAVADLRATLDDMRGQRDSWQRQAERLALPKPAEPELKPAPETWWHWLRSTG